MAPPTEAAFGSSIHTGGLLTHTKSPARGSVCLAYAVAVATMWCAWQAGLQKDGLDYYTFWGVIQCHRDPDSDLGRDGIYGMRSQQRIGLAAERTLSQVGLSARQRSATQANLQLYQGRIETTATPFFYAMLGPLVTGNYERDFRLFIMVSLAAHVASIGLLCRIMGYSPAMTAWSIALFGLPFLPFRSNIGVLNVGSLQVFQVAAVVALLSHASESWAMPTAGCVLGLSIAFKPTIFPVLIAVSIVLLSDSRWRAVGRVWIGVVAGCGIAWLVGALFLGDWRSWPAWLDALKAVLGSDRLVNPWNCSVPMVLKSVMGIDCGGGILVALLGVTATLAYRRRDWCSSEAQSPVASSERVVLAAALGCVIPMVSAPLVWAHYHLLSIPLVLWVVRKSMANDSACGAPEMYRSVTALAVLLLSVVAQAMGLGRQTNELILGNAAMILLLGLGFHDFATTGGMLHARRSPSADPPHHDDLVVGVERP